jgi:hypothetical protein
MDRHTENRKPYKEDSHYAPFSPHSLAWSPNNQIPLLKETRSILEKDTNTKAAACPGASHFCQGKFQQQWQRYGAL